MLRIIIIIISSSSSGSNSSVGGGGELEEFCSVTTQFLSSKLCHGDRSHKALHFIGPCVAVEILFLTLSNLDFRNL